jgi:hypothetical protein
MIKKAEFLEEARLRADGDERVGPEAVRKARRSESMSYRLTPPRLWPISRSFSPTFLAAQASARSARTFARIAARSPPSLR